MPLPKWIILSDKIMWNYNFLGKATAEEEIVHFVGLGYDL